MALKPVTPEDVAFILSKYEAVYDQAVVITPELAQKMGHPTSGVHYVVQENGKTMLRLKPHMAMQGLTKVDPAEATLVEGHRGRFSSPGFYAEQKARYRERDRKAAGATKTQD